MNKNIQVVANIGSTGSNELSNKYYSLFDVIPNLVNFPALLNYEKVWLFLKEKGYEKIEHRYFTSFKDKIPYTVCNFTHYKDQIYIVVDSNGIFILYNDIYPEDLVYELSVNKGKKYTRIIKIAKQLSIIVPEQGGYRTTFKTLKRTDYNPENYNADFADKHKLIVDTINEKRSGLYLFFGAPGTGKSSYIASLTQMKTNKKFIYLPSSLFTSLDSPQLMKLFLDNCNAIFIIEDGEKLLTNRENDVNSPISALLNMSDGLIGQLLNSQIICTFNTNVANIDKALERKGRLICSYEFKPLAQERAIELAKKLKKPFDHIDGPMVLGDIYNYDDESFVVAPERKRIGYKK